MSHVPCVTFFLMAFLDFTTADSAHCAANESHVQSITSSRTYPGFSLTRPHLFVSTRPGTMNHNVFKRDVEGNYTDADIGNNTALLVQSERLADDIIFEYRRQEQTFGHLSRNFTVLVSKSVVFFQDLVSGWNVTSPEIADALKNITIILDNLTIASIHINQRLIKLKEVSDVLDYSRVQKYLDDVENRQGDCAASPEQRSDHQLANKSGRSFVHKHLHLHLHQHSHNHSRRVTRDTSGQSNSFPTQPDTVKNNHTHLANWWNPLFRVVTFLIETETWYGFFDVITKKLGDYYTQLYLIQGSTAEFTNWTENENITKENLKDAVERMEKEFTIEFKFDISLLVNSSDKTRLSYLNDVIKATIKTPVACTHKDNVVYIGGSFIFVSQVTTCAKSVLQQNKSFDTMSIAATHAFYIDNNLVTRNINPEPPVSNRSLGAVIISPLWLVVGSNREINLTPPDRGQNPNPGAPGYPGPNGGHLIAVAPTMAGGRLKVTSNGGTGGKGGAGPLAATVFLACRKTNMMMLSGGRVCCSSKDLNYIYKGFPGGKAGVAGLAGRIMFFVPSGAALPPKVTVERKRGKKGVVGEGRPYVLTTTSPGAQVLQDSGIFSGGLGLCSKNKVYVLPLSASDKRALTGANGGDSRPPIKHIPLQFDLHDFVSPYTNFRQVSRRASHLFSWDIILNMTSYLDNNETIQRAYYTIDYIDEFFEIEQQAPTIKYDHQLLYYYDTLQIRSQKAAENATASGKMDDFKVLIFLYSAALAKKLAITNPYEPIFVVNVYDFLVSQRERIRALQAVLAEELKFEQINNLMKDYNENIQKRFEQASYLAETVILPEIDKVEAKLKELTQALLQYIQEEKMKADCDIKKLQKYRNALLKNAVVNGIFGAVKLAGSAISMAHPVGHVVSAVADGAKTIYGTINDPGKPPTGTAHVPQAALDHSRKNALRFRTSSKNSLRTFVLQLEATKILLEPYSSDFAGPIGQIDSVNQETKGLMETPGTMSPYAPADSIHAFYSLLDSEKFIKDRQEMLEKIILQAVGAKRYRKHKCGYHNGTGRQTEKPPPMPTMAPKPDLEKRAKAAAMVITAATSMFDGILKDIASIQEVAGQIEAAMKLKLLLANHEKRIEEEMIPELDDMLYELSRLQDQVAGQSVVALDVIRWRITSIIRDTKFDFKQLYTEGTPIAPYMDRALEKLEEGLNVYVQIHQRLDAYQDQAALANFTAKLQLNPSFYLTKLSDEKLDKAVRQMRNVLQAGVLLKRHLLIVGTYRMWRFPMVDPALCNINNLNLTKFNSSDNSSINSFLEFLSARTTEMIQYVEDSRQGAVPGDKYTQTGDFTHKKESSQPFVIWYNSSQATTISDFFDGENVEFYADPLKGPEFCEAIKFNRVALYFKSTEGNVTLEQELMKRLNPFRLVLLHQGVSYYLFANDTYAFPGSPIDIEFNFELKDDGVTPTFANEFYNKILKGDISISPYAFWSMKMEPIKSGTNFSRLQEYKEKVDLYFEGSGKCIAKKFASEGSYRHPECLGS